VRFIVRTKILSLTLLLIFLSAFPYLAWAWSGKVISIADGDTITVLRDKEQVRIRLYGIDCPEGGQAFGKKAKQFTSSMVFGKVVEVESVDIDRYGRTVALVTVFQRLVNEELVNAGFAWIYTRYCDRPICERWKVLEYEAREAKRGLWSEPNPVPPWEYRKKKRSQ
jgi:endonuclease YncB( thermonuclease family)